MNNKIDESATLALGSVISDRFQFLKPGSRESNVIIFVEEKKIRQTDDGGMRLLLKRSFGLRATESGFEIVRSCVLSAQQSRWKESREPVVDRDFVVQEDLVAAALRDGQSPIYAALVSDSAMVDGLHAAFSDFAEALTQAGKPGSPPDGALAALMSPSFETLSTDEVFEENSMAVEEKKLPGRPFSEMSATLWLRQHMARNGMGIQMSHRIDIEVEQRVPDPVSRTFTVDETLAARALAKGRSPIYALVESDSQCMAELLANFSSFRAVMEQAIFQEGTPIPDKAPDADTTRRKRRRGGPI